MTGSSGVEPSPSVPRVFLVALLVLGALISVTAVPGVFTIDEDNYLVNVIAIRDGHVTVSNTAGLSPSRELAFFDPGAWARAVESTPVASTAPPLYAPLALPFSWFGWRGLVALNTLAFLATTWMVFSYVRRHAAGPLTPWLAAAAFALGGFAVEYAQGMWPHALSIALCTGGIVAAGRGLESGRPLAAATAGFLLALATGVRYQNAVLLSATGAAVAFWSARRWRMLSAFGVAAALPLLASATINHFRLGSWNPISKGPGYLRVPVLQDDAGSLLDPVIMFWARVADFSARPPLVGPMFAWVHYDPVTGAHLMMGGAFQKAFLQSAPWALLAFLLFTLAWSRRFAIPDARRRQVRLLSLAAVALLATFAFSGVHRHEGVSFNQRYLLELLPLAAVAFAWALDGLTTRVEDLCAGALGGAIAALVLLFILPWGPVRQWALLKVPLMMALALGILWFVARGRHRARLLLTVTAGVCLGWAMALHLGDDVAASRRLRSSNLEAVRALQAVLPDRSALITYWGSKDAVGPLLFDRDIVILDAHADEGKDAPMLIRELLARGRRVFVVQAGFPGEVLSRVLAGWKVVPLARPGAAVLELRPRPD